MQRIQSVSIPSVSFPTLTPPASKQAVGVNFGDTLNQELQKQSDLKISAHAQKRLDERNVELTPDYHQRLNNAVNKIGQAGADKSLVLMDNLALVVSARNRVVITAIDSASAKGGVFTNIDSAVIA